MAEAELKSCRARISLILGIVCLSTAVGLFIPGGLTFSEENPKVLNYVKSTCLIVKKTREPYQCPIHHYKPLCYQTTWEVVYDNKEDIHATVVTGEDEEYDYQINLSYSCWYDTRNPVTAQWKEPSIQLPRILLICGGLGILLAILFFYLSYRFNVRKKREITRNNMMSISVVQ